MREDERWRTNRRGKGRKGYLFNHEALSKVFRAKLLAGIVDAGLTRPGRYPEKWVVDCKSVGTGEPALIYLGRYLYRGASGSRISSPSRTVRNASYIERPRGERRSSEPCPVRISCSLTTFKTVCRADCRCAVDNRSISRQGLLSLKVVILL
jgi:hypothetical protein